MGSNIMVGINCFKPDVFMWISTLLLQILIMITDLLEKIKNKSVQDYRQYHE